MSYQRGDWQRPVILQIDLNQATFQAFLNCINSFQGLETESEMRGGSGVTRSFMTSKVSMERFVYNLGVLDGILARDDSKFEPEADGFNPFKYWKEIVKYLKEVGFFKHARRISHL